MNILLVSAELAPLASTGGLGESVAALAVALARAKHQITVVVPAYNTADGTSHPELWRDATCEAQIKIPVGSHQLDGRILRMQMPGQPIEILLIDQPDYFSRPGIYSEGSHIYDDDCERWVFFSRAVIAAMRQLSIEPDVVHCHDWPTGLIPALLKIEERRTPGLNDVGTVFTAHNMAYQGQFWHWDMELTGLDWRYFNWRQMEFFGKLNLLKTGLVFSDQLTTVSPTYAKEILEPEAAHGLHGVLRARASDLTGILSGLDHNRWNPANDVCLPQNYDYKTFAEGKRACQAEFLREIGWKPDPDRGLAVISQPQNSEQGLDILAGSFSMWPSDRFRLVVLQRSAGEVAEPFRSWIASRPDQVKCLPRESERMARLAWAAADMSWHVPHAEPSATAQMVALAYGAVPVAHLTGALADTLVDATVATVGRGTANGFGYVQDTPDGFLLALRRALETHEQPRLWRTIVQAGMHHDWSWMTTADQYLDVYRKAALRETQPQPLVTN